MKPKKEEECAASASPQSLMNRAWDLSMYRYAGRENAPAPVAKQPVEITVELGGEDITQHVIDPLRGAVTAELRSTEWKFADSGAAFLEMLRDTVREAVRAELVVVEGTAVGSHSTAVKDGTWDAGANEGHLPSPVPVATVRKMYTYYDEDKVEDGGVPKSACKLPHHFVSADGTPGAASINGVRNALARLPQTQGLSDAERKTAEAHLRAHLNAYSGGDEEDHVREEIDDAERKLPPFLQPDEDEEEEGDEECSENVVEEDPEASASPTHNETDDWADLVGCLTTASPSADDVFNMLKEAW